MRRRELLTTSGIALAALAGCAGEEDDNSDTASSDSDTSSDSDSGNGDGNGESDDSGALEILDHELVVEEFQTTVEGRLENNTGEEQDYIEVKAVFYNADGERLEDGLDNATDVPDGEIVHFEIYFTGDDPDAIDSYELETSTSAV